MNKLLKALFILALLVSPAFIATAQTGTGSSTENVIAVISPAADTTFKPGDTLKISIIRGKQVQTLPLNITLVSNALSRKDVPVSTQIISTGSKLSSFNWKIPTTIKEGSYSIVVQNTSVKFVERINITIAKPTPVSKEYALVTPGASSTIAIGSTMNITWTRPANSMARTSIRLQNIPNPSKRIGLQQFVIAKAVTADTYAWTVPANIAPGIYKLLVGPEAGNGGPRVTGTTATVFITKSDGTGTSTSPVGDPVFTAQPLVQQVAPNWYVLSEENGAQQIAFNGFTAKSEGSTSTIDTVSVKVNRVGSSSLPTTVYLWDKAGTLYASKAVLSDGIITFDNVSVHILKDRTTDFLIKADMPSSAISSSTISIDITDVTTKYGKVIKTGFPLVGERITFIKTMNSVGVANYQSAGEPTITTVVDRNGVTTNLMATFPMQVIAVGGNIPQPKASDFVVIFESASTTILSPSISAVTVPFNQNGVAQGSISTVTVTASVSGSKLKTGFFKAKMINVKTPNGFADLVTPTAVRVSAPVQSGGINVLAASVGEGFKIVFGNIASLFGF